MNYQNKPLASGTTPIYRAVPDDIPVIRAIAFEVWPVTYGPILSKAQLDYMLELMYSEDALKKQMIVEDRPFIILKEEQPVGFASYSILKEGSVLRIHKLYVLTSEQGKGRGRLLLEYLRGIAVSSGCEAIELHVNRHNQARGFYEKAGMRVVAEEDRDIGNGFWMNDYLMRLELKTPVS